MKIAPIDIAHKTFARKVMGLDADEVADFLRDVADQMEEIIRERNSLKESLRQKDLQIMEYRERDETLKQTIQTATKMSESIRLDAEREGKLIVNDAQQKAELIMKDSRDSLKRVYQEIADLKRTRMQFEINLRSICQAHLSMIDQGHLNMPDPQINLAHAAASVGSAGTVAGNGAVHGGTGIANSVNGAGINTHVAAHSHAASGNISGVTSGMPSGASVTHVNMPTPGYNSPYHSGRVNNSGVGGSVGGGVGKA
jgi:cell division initiation protein